jgi:hypothetical protein
VPVDPHGAVGYLVLLVFYRQKMDEMMMDAMNCLNYLMDAMMMGVQKVNAVLKDDQMVDVSFYALPL